MVRRHRLAERLLTDLFRIKDDGVEENACRFEHVLQKDVEESVCTLLGHPRSCPHGKAISEGPCCGKAGKVLKRLVFNARDADKGARGKIAYLETKNNKVLQKLMAMGVLPGVPGEVMQTFPAYVLTVGNTQVAIDKEMAECIFMRSGREVLFPECHGGRYGRKDSCCERYGLRRLRVLCRKGGLENPLG